MGEEYEYDGFDYAEDMARLRLEKLYDTYRKGGRAGREGSLRRSEYYDIRPEWAQRAPLLPSLKMPESNYHLHASLHQEEIKKESSVGYGNDSYNNNSQPTDQEVIDAAVREAIAKPKREAEIAARVAAVAAFAVFESYDNGTVMTWTRPTSTKPKAHAYTYAAVKVDDVWFVSGGSARGTAYTSDELIDWMTTQAPLVQGVKVATEWSDVIPAE